MEGEQWYGAAWVQSLRILASGGRRPCGNSILILCADPQGRMTGLDVQQTNPMPPTMGRQDNEERKININWSSPTLLLQQMIRLPLV